MKHKPRYITRVNAAGDFTFRNLPPGVYNVYALQDQSGQKVYNNREELFAFADTTVHVADSTNVVKLFAYAEEKPKPKPVATTTSAADKKLKYKTSIEGDRQDLLTPLTIEFNHLLKNFDSLKIQLTDTLFNQYKNITVTLDTTRKKITVQNSWLDNSDYRLIISKNFATDTSGVGLLKPDTIKFKTKKESDYGSIKLNFKNLEKFKNPVLQFVSNNEVVKSYPLTSAVWSAKLFNPGDYELRILEDANENGVWDPGNYHLKSQPEKAYAIPQKLNIKANWDNERDIIL